MRTTLLATLFATLTSLLATTAVADQLPRREISVQGQASRLVAPDQVELRLAIEARDKDPGKAMNTLGAQAQAVVDLLARFADKSQIRALQTQLREVVRGTDRSWRRDSGEAVEMLASRQIQLQRLDIDQLADVMQALSRQSIAHIDAVNPQVSNAAEIEDQILLLAIDDARQRAERIAKRLEVKLGLPIAVHVQAMHAPQPKLAMRAMAMDAEMAGGGYEAIGEDQIQARVSVSFEIEAP